MQVRGSNITSSQSLSQSSQSSASSHIQVDVHNTSRGSNTGNEALCLEILGALLRGKVLVKVRCIIIQKLYNNGRILVAKMKETMIRVILEI